MQREKGIAVKGVLVHDARILMIRRCLGARVGAGIWELPGGKLEFGEHLEEALVREIQEETGLNASVDRLLYAVDFLTSPTRHVVLLAYLCHADSDQVVLSEEHIDYRWADIAQLEQLLDKDILADLKRYDVLRQAGMTA